MSRICRDAMSTKSSVKVTPSSGNVFRDVGFSREELELMALVARYHRKVEPPAKGAKRAVKRRHSSGHSSLWPAVTATTDLPCWGLDSHGRRQVWPGIKSNKGAFIRCGLGIIFEPLTPITSEVKGGCHVGAQGVCHYLRDGHHCS